MRFDLDAAPVIYAVEQAPDFAPLVDERLSGSDAVLVASDLTRMECRVKRLRDNDDQLLQDYDRFFLEALTECILLSRQVLDLATGIRARYGFKVLAAVHLAASITAGCERFLTNDRRLERFSGIAMDVIQSKL